MTGNTLGDVLVVLAVIMGGVALLGLALIGFVVWRYRIPMRGIVAMGAALLYLVSPIDILPEGLLGPFGLIDDAGVVGMTTLFVMRLIQAQKMLRDAGVDLRRAPRPSRRSGQVHRVRNPKRSWQSPQGWGVQDRPRVQNRSPEREPGASDPDANWWREDADDADPPAWGTPPR